MSVLTVASWPAYRFPRRKVFPSLLKKFPQFVMMHTVKGFRVVNEADVFLELPCFLHDPTNVSHLISVSSAFLKSCLYVWKFLIHVSLKSSLKDFEYNVASMWNELSCMAVWTFFGIVILWDWNENWPFPVLWPLLSFPNLLIECSTFTASSFRILNSSAGIPSPPLALFIVMLPKAHDVWL